MGNSSPNRIYCVTAKSPQALSRVHSMGSDFVPLGGPSVNCNMDDPSTPRTRNLSTKASATRHRDSVAGESSGAMSRFSSRRGHGRGCHAVSTHPDATIVDVGPRLDPEAHDGGRRRYDRSGSSVSEAIGPTVQSAFRFKCPSQRGGIGDRRPAGRAIRNFATARRSGMARCTRPRTGNWIGLSR